MFKCITINFKTVTYIYVACNTSVGDYGFDCNRTCDCHNNGTCDGTIGCVCTDGWTGHDCTTGTILHVHVLIINYIVDALMSTCTCTHAMEF